jgi:TolB-like protein/Tfp pilus assembly protein PilF
VNPFSHLLRELRRRRVLSMTAYYIVAAWVVVQVVSLVLPAMGIDEFALRYVWLAIIVGFPLAVFFSWRYDIGADGLHRTPPADQTPVETLKLRKADYAILVVLIAIAGFTISTMTGQVLEEQAAIDVAPETRDINPHSVAILPLENLDPETTERYFVAGMYDSLISHLGKVNALQVTSRTSAMRVNTSQGMPYIGRKLGVANVVEASVLRDGNNVRISVKLIDAASDQHIWSETYERPFDDVMAIQASVARTVARVIQAKLTAEDEEQLARSLDIRPATFEAYLRAMYQFQKETQKGYRQGITILQEALENDPTSALAYAALGQGYVELQHSTLPISEAAYRAKAAAEKAIELDPTLAEGYLALGLYTFYSAWEYDEGIRLVRKALELNPSLAPAWYHLAWFLEIKGTDEEAIAAGEKTIELSPLNDFYTAWLADQYRNAGDFTRAERLVEQVLSLNPNHPIALLVQGNIHLDKGNYADAAATHQKIAHYRFWEFAYAVSSAYAGDLETTREILDTYEPEVNNAIVLAMLHAVVGDTDEAIHWMEQARDARIGWYIGLFNFFPATRALHQDPRFIAMAEEAGIELEPLPGD